MQLDLIVAHGHDRHWVKERGYVESPKRIPAIESGLGGFAMRALPLRRFPNKWITEVHSQRLVDFIRTSSGRVAEGRYEYPYIIPVRRQDDPPREWDLAIGYYCIDTFTPIHRDAFATARVAVDAALTAAASLVDGSPAAYALVRPPGHHAERHYFGGFCYLNSSAIAAEYLSTYGKVAMLDVDYHHGNGQQDIFWERNDVLTVSIHGHPRYAYPYFSGYSDEVGSGPGKGFNVNFPLSDKRKGHHYRSVLGKAVELIQAFDPDYLVVPLGFDTAKNDPTGSWELAAADFVANGKIIAKLDRPTLFVQEGGYRMGTLGSNARSFFGGFLCGR